MPVTVVIGTQWGDEGKGKVVDVLAGRSDLVVRFQGGNNAGHTIVVGDATYKLHLVPSGIISGKTCVIGNGCVVDPFVLVSELEALRARGISAKLHLSDRAHLILPYHKVLDGLEERARGEKVGTTGRGIGPCYADKAARAGVVAGDLLDLGRLEKRVREACAAKTRILQAYGVPEPADADDIMRQLRPVAKALAPHVSDTVRLVQDAAAAGKAVLLEGAQGVMLDIDHGTYPYVTSSNTASAFCGGTGLSPRSIGEVLGVVKAYTTRVGAGPMPTELPLDAGPGQHMSTVGREVGTTTGRARRCGWLDLVVVRHAIRLTGATQLAVTKLDVLGGMGDLRVCTRYRLPDGSVTDRVPSDPEVFAAAKPVLNRMKGWTQASATRWQDLPKAAVAYLDMIAKECGVPITMVGIGPGREHTLTAPGPTSRSTKGVAPRPRAAASAAKPSARSRNPSTPRRRKPGAPTRRRR